MHDNEWKDILRYNGFLFDIVEGIVSICDMETGLRYLSFNADVSPREFINHVNQNGIRISGLTIEQVDNFPFDIYIKEKYDMQATLDLIEILYIILDVTTPYKPVKLTSP